jgi:hypothetical protein
MGTKTCKGCTEDKPLDEFHKHPLGRQGRQPQCKRCTADRQRERVAALTDGERSKRNHRVKLYRYGLTPADYEQMHDAQAGLCAICFLPETNGNRLSVDHCHDTSIVRGLLCNDCNVSLGRMAEDPDRLERAAAYLRRMR